MYGLESMDGKERTGREGSREGGRGVEQGKVGESCYDRGELDCGEGVQEVGKGREGVYLLCRVLLLEVFVTVSMADSP